MIKKETDSSKVLCPEDVPESGSVETSSLSIKVKETFQSQHI